MDEPLEPKQTTLNRRDAAFVEGYANAVADIVDQADG